MSRTSWNLVLDGLLCVFHRLYALQDNWKVCQSANVVVEVPLRK